jgi:molecular chaperone DnaJ
MAGDPYEILGVRRDATPEEIKKAYKEAALRHHPDRNPGDPAAEERFKQVTAAYQILSDPEKKRSYDTFGSAEVGGMPPINLDIDDVLDIFQGVFGFGGGGKRRRRARRGADVRLGVEITLEESYLGGRRRVTYRSRAVCETCRGTGGTQGSSMRPCPSCGGEGEVLYNQGFLMLKRLCTRCHGKGRVPTSPCGDCAGEGGRTAERQIEIVVPPGVMDGQEHRVAGRGEPSDGDGPPGDLVVAFRVRPDPRFERDGIHLVSEVEVPYHRAALGGDVDVTLPGGRVVTVKLKPGTQHGAIVRSRGWGFAGVGGLHGDLMVRIRLAVPKELTERQRALLELLAEEGSGGDPSIWDKVKDVFK